MNMVIRAYWPDGELKSTVVYPEGGGYESPKAAQKELLRRWKNKPSAAKPFGNGIECRADGGIRQTVTFE